jgi:hypothetical protein
MQGHLKINIDLFSALCPPQLHKYVNPSLSFFLHVHHKLLKNKARPLAAYRYYSIQSICLFVGNAPRILTEIRENIKVRAFSNST